MARVATLPSELFFTAGVGTGAGADLGCTVEVTAVAGASALVSLSGGAVSTVRFLGFFGVSATTALSEPDFLPFTVVADFLPVSLRRVPELAASSPDDVDEDDDVDDGDPASGEDESFEVSELDEEDEPDEDELDEEDVPDEEDESDDESEEDELEESVPDGPAQATPGVLATATPTPSATARPPTRPMYLA